MPEGAPLRQIAPSLVEAGVDVDFPIIRRGRAGLESIIQAAGRCNREGRSESGGVFGFPFETIAERFRLIETALVPVIVPYRGPSGGDDKAKRLPGEVKWAERPSRVARRLQPYVVQIPPLAGTALLASRAAKPVREADFDQFVALTGPDLYLADIGLTSNEPTLREAQGVLW